MMEKNQAASREGICVAIRMRPLNEREKNSGQEKIFNCLPNYNAVAQLKDGVPLEGQISYFDKVFDEQSVNKEVYSHIARDIVKGLSMME